VGPLPASWAGMTSLEKLVLSLFLENSLSGALPPACSCMASLKVLWLEYNEMGMCELSKNVGFLLGLSKALHYLCFWGGAPACQLG
jgi:hypothetical protein